VNLHGAPCEGKHPRYLFVSSARGNETDDLLLSRRQQMLLKHGQVPLLSRRPSPFSATTRQPCGNPSSRANVSRAWHPADIRPRFFDICVSFVALANGPTNATAGKCSAGWEVPAFALARMLCGRDAQPCWWSGVTIRLEQHRARVALAFIAGAVVVKPR